jgi:flagellar motor switch protein FliN
MNEGTWMNTSLEEAPASGDIHGESGDQFAIGSEKSSNAMGGESTLQLSESQKLERAFQNPNNLVNGATREIRRADAVMPQGSLLKIPVNVQVILGTTRMLLSQVMLLEPGSVVVLDKELSEPVSLLVNGNEVARGLIVVVNEKTGQLGISLTDIASGGLGSSSSRPV